MFFGEVIQN